MSESDAQSRKRGGNEGSPDLTFPDVPRLQLEELLGQLTASAQEVLRTQGRLRALLRATATVAGDLSLQVVLRQIAAAARELVGARYAALGVLGQDGSLEEFIHVGMAEADVAAIGDLPRGRGILGLLMTRPEPVRLADLSTHPAAAGFPAGHPPMTSFLGVPIRVRGHAFGNLYLTDSSNGEFSSEDEQLAVALAASAGVAIENARLFEESERRRRWEVVSTEATQALLAGNQSRPLQSVLRYANEGAAGDAAMFLLHAEGGVLVDAAAGESAAELEGVLTGVDRQVTAQVFDTGKPLLISDISPAGGPLARFGSMMVAPLTVRDQDRATRAVAVARLAGGRPFDSTDLAQLVVFADHARITMELDHARADREQLGLLREHERIAADLHDHVVQELFATGMGLQGMVGHLSGADRARVMGYVDNIDATIRRIRSTIFQLQRPPEPLDGLRQVLAAVAEEEREALGFAAELEISLPPDAVIPPGLAEDIAAVLREALSNAARHAQATLVRAVIALAGGTLSVDVTDNGVGIGRLTRSSGLTNMRRRAEKYGGDLELAAPPGGGTSLHWTARI